MVTGCQEPRSRDAELQWACVYVCDSFVFICLIYPQVSLTWLDVDGGAAGRRPRRVDGCDAVRPNAARPHLLYQQAVTVPLGRNHVESIAPYGHIILSPRY